MKYRFVFLLVIGFSGIAQTNTVSVIPPMINSAGELGHFPDLLIDGVLISSGKFKDMRIPSKYILGKINLKDSSKIVVNTKLPYEVDGAFIPVKKRYLLKDIRDDEIAFIEYIPRSDLNNSGVLKLKLVHPGKR